MADACNPVYKFGVEMEALGVRVIEPNGLGVISPPKGGLPVEFGFESEHPVVSLPFSLYILGQKFEGEELSITSIHTKTREDTVLIAGSRHAARLQFEFENFSVSIYPEVLVVGESGTALSLKFANPTGDHVAQLRFVLNSYIAGDFVTLGAAMAYSGPTKPKEEKKAVEQSWVDRYRSIGVAVVSAALILWAATALFIRYTTTYEMHPVLIERAGQPMQATTAGQIAYLNADAKQGEVLFSVNANSGDVLNFQMPCACEVVVNQGISEGVTVLPTDVILTILVNNVELRVQTLMSVEGLARAMNGDRVFLDMTDGTSIPVQVSVGQTSNAAAMRGELFVPVQLVAADGALADEDIGKFARLRLSKSFFWH